MRARLEPGDKRQRESASGALASQWIPDDPSLWKIGNAFLDARKALLGQELTRRTAELLHGHLRWLESRSPVPPTLPIDGGITSEEEERELERVNAWMERQGLLRGCLAYDFDDVGTGEQKAVFDLAWQNGIQEELSQPVAN